MSISRTAFHGFGWAVGMGGLGPKFLSLVATQNTAWWLRKRIVSLILCSLRWANINAFHGFTLPVIKSFTEGIHTIFCRPLVLHLKHNIMLLEMMMLIVARFRVWLLSLLSDLQWSAHQLCQWQWVLRSIIIGTYVIWIQVFPPLSQWTGCAKSCSCKIPWLYYYDSARGPRADWVALKVVNDLSFIL